MMFSSFGKFLTIESKDLKDTQRIEDFPNAIQLFSNEPIQFHDNANSSSTEKQKYNYAALTYESVYDSKNSIGSKPTFGVWNCRCNSSNENRLESISLLLKNVAFRSFSKVPVTLIIPADLSEPRKVYSSVKFALETVIGVFKSMDDDELNKIDFDGGCCTTSLSSLTTSSSDFGTAPTTVTPEKEIKEKSRDVSFSLVICGILPNKSPDDPPLTYVEKQAQNLVLYHLHRLAKNCNCAFLLMSLGQQSKADPSAVTVNEEEKKTDSATEFDLLREYLHRSTTGQDLPSPFKNDTNIQFFLPNNHDDDVISGIMLRNATCDGYWDASKDSLEKALGSTGTSKLETGDKKKIVEMESEDVWLGKLASKLGKVIPSGSTNDGTGSVSGSSSNTSARGEKKGKTKKPNRDTSSSEPNKDVSVFFENLMKQKK